MGVNKVILMGNIGKSPELKNTPSGQSVCSFSLATNEKYTDKQGQKINKTEWHNIVAWGKTGENINKFFDKGDSIYLEGKIVTRKWDNNEGQTIYRTEIIASSFEFVGSKKSGSDIDQSESIQEDLPF